MWVTAGVLIDAKENGTKVHEGFVDSGAAFSWTLPIVFILCVLYYKLLIVASKGLDKKYAILRNLVGMVSLTVSGFLFTSLANAGFEAGRGMEQSSLEAQIVCFCLFMMVPLFILCKQCATFPKH